jgi:hypothetical protein
MPQFSLNIDDVQYAAFKKLCEEKLKCSMSEGIRRAIDQFLTENTAPPRVRTTSTREKITDLTKAWDKIVGPAR